MRVRLDISSEGIEVFWEEHRHRVSLEALSEVEKIGRAARALTQPASELKQQLWGAGRSLWASTLGECDFPYQNGQPIDIEVCLIEPLPQDLAAVPWECLLEPQSAMPVAYHRDFTIFRSTGSAPEEPAPAEAPTALRILVLAMDTESAAGVTWPEESYPPDKIDAKGEIAKLRESLNHLESEGLVSFKLFGPENPVTLRQAREFLESDHPHVLHYIGHSGPAGGGGATTSFLFVGEDGAWARVPERAFLSMLVGLKSPPCLLVLNSCHSAGPLLSAGLPAKLQRLGLRAIVAMRSAIDDDIAVLFAENFYRKLANGASVAAACREGRLHLRYAAPSLGHWILPILYATEPGTRILRIESLEGSKRPSSFTRVSFMPATRWVLKGLEPYDEKDRDGFPGRGKEVQEALDLLLKCRNLILFGGAGVGKSSLVRAGLLPVLREAGFQPVYASRWETFAAGITEEVAEGKVAFIFDQAEAALADGELGEALCALFRSRPALLLVVVREAGLPALREGILQCDEAPFAELRLPAVTHAGARQIFGDLRQQYGIEFEPGLLNDCLSDLTPEGGAGAATEVFLPFLSLLVTRLCGTLQPAERPFLNRFHYQRVGGLRGVAADHFRQVMDRFGEEGTAGGMLARLVDERTSRQVVQPDEELTRGLPPISARAALADMVAARLVQPLTDGRYVLSHPFLISEVLGRIRGGDRTSRFRLRARARGELGVDLDPGQVDPEDLAGVNPSILSRDELAAYIGWALLRSDVPLEERTAEVAALRLREAMGLLWRSASPGLLCRLTAFSGRLPSHRRGPAPFSLLPGLGGDAAQARFASEWLFQALAEKAAKARDDEQAQKALTDLLRNAVTLEQPLNDPKLIRLIDAMELRWDLGFRGGLFGPLALWPGSTLVFRPFLLGAVVTAAAVAWSIWPSRALSLVQLADYLTFVALLALTTMAAFGSEILDEIFSPPSVPNPKRGLARLRSLFASCLLLVFSLMTYRVLGTSLVSISNWIHEGVLMNLGFWQRIAVSVQRIPEAGLSGFLGAGRRVVEMLATFVKGFLVLNGDSMLLGGALAPATVLLCASQRAVLRAFLLWRLHGGALRLLKIATALLLSGICLPTAVSIGHQVIRGLRPILWHDDFFLGRGSGDFIVASLGWMAGSPWTWLVGSILPLVAMLLALMGASRARRQTWGRLGEDLFLSKSPALIRLLVAEGTFESLCMACRLVRRFPKVRGPETVTLLVGLAAKQEEVFLALIAPREKCALAAKALDVLSRLAPSTPGVREALEDLKRRLTVAMGSNRESLEKVQAVLEGLRAPQDQCAWSRFGPLVVRALGWRGPAPWREKDGWVWSRGHGWSRARLRALFPAAVAGLAILAALAALWHLATVSACRGLYILFPLSEPFGPKFFRPWTSFVPVVRATELALPFLLWYGLAGLVKRRSSSKVEAEGTL